MIEAIILSTLTFIGGFFVGALSILKSRIKFIKLDEGLKICMWKGFVVPDKTFVAARKDGCFLDGVVFDKNGHIIRTEICQEVKVE